MIEFVSKVEEELKKDLVDIYMAVEKKFDLPKNLVVNLSFVSEKKIKELNSSTRGIDKVTDVISFAFEDNDKKEYNNMRILGEIYICIPRMKQQAIDYGHGQMRELAFLGVHGLLHLLGYDHMAKEDEKIMFTLQDEILPPKEN